MARPRRPRDRRFCVRNLRRESHSPVSGHVVEADADEQHIAQGVGGRRVGAMQFAKRRLGRPAPGHCGTRRNRSVECRRSGTSNASLCRVSRATRFRRARWSRTPPSERSFLGEPSSDYRVVLVEAKSDRLASEQLLLDEILRHAAEVGAVGGLLLLGEGLAEPLDSPLPMVTALRAEAPSWSAVATDDLIDAETAEEAAARKCTSGSRRNLHSHPFHGLANTPLQAGLFRRRRVPDRRRVGALLH